MSTYAVTIDREIRYTATIDVDARTADEAEWMAQNEVDNTPGLFVEGAVLSQTTKARLKR